MMFAGGYLKHETYELRKKVVNGYDVTLNKRSKSLQTYPDYM
nr:MAG TPA: hypothetical protein [Caudoviricetes sp.]